MSDNENTLRKKLGGLDMKQVFTPEKIQEAQAVLNEATDRFVKEAHQQIEEIDRLYHTASADTATASEHIKQMGGIAHQLKGRMESLGFLFCFQIADSLDRYTQNPNKNPQTALMVIGKHIHALQAAIREHLESDGGKIGKEMVDVLSQLIEKVKNID